jgi:hypothetical protein
LKAVSGQGNCYRGAREMNVMLYVFMLFFGLFLFLRPSYCVKSTGEIGEAKKKQVKGLGMMFMSIAVIHALFVIF